MAALVAGYTYVIWKQSTLAYRGQCRYRNNKVSASFTWQLPPRISKGRVRPFWSGEKDQKEGKLTFLLCNTIVNGNIFSGNRPLHANYGNFNPSRTILIQGGTREKAEGVICKIRGRWVAWFAEVRWSCKSLLPPPLIAPLDRSRSCDSDWSFP
jgi:hypothetical protein